jgi:hypothetical protein
VREKYCWLVAGGWFVLREKYCCLVADKPNEQAAFVSLTSCIVWNGGNECVVPEWNGFVPFTKHMEKHPLRTAVSRKTA